MVDSSKIHNETYSITLKLKIRNEGIKEFTKAKFSEWKKFLYKKYKNIINTFINNYDELKIKEFLEYIVIIQVDESQNNFLDYYYCIFYSLLSLNKRYLIIIKNNFNKNSNIRELLFVRNVYYNKLNNKYEYYSSNDDSKNDKSNKDNKRLSDKDSTKCLYITILKNKKTDEGSIRVLDDNEEFIFNGIKLKNTFNKFVKFGIRIYEKECDVNYEINYGNDFKRKEMPKIIYIGEFFERFNLNDF